MPALGGPAKRVGNFEVTDASWSADGKKLVYSTLGDIYLAGKDGENPRKLAGFVGLIQRPQISPTVPRFDSRGGTWRTMIVRYGKFPSMATGFVNYFRNGRVRHSIPMGSGRRMGNITCSIRTDRDMGVDGADWASKPWRQTNHCS